MGQKVQCQKILKLYLQTKTYFVFLILPCHFKLLKQGTAKYLTGGAKEDSLTPLHDEVVAGLRKNKEVKCCWTYISKPLQNELAFNVFCY